jgi:ABC-type transport system involved in multi-copper enzyme maturation permease subunit
VTELEATRMLLFKAWKESQTRFLIIAAAIAIFCAMVVLFNVQLQRHPEQIPPGFRGVTYSEHVYDFVYGGMAKGLFVVLMLFIGLGGLLRERRRGPAAFTLALPATRTQMMVAQIVVGVLEVFAIAALPLILIPTLSPLVDQFYSVSTSLHFALLWLGGGLMVFALAFLCSALFAGEYTALVVAFLGIFAVPLAAQVPALQPYRVNFLQTMGEFGTMHWNPEHSLLLPSPMPWMRLLVFSGISAGLLWIALTVTKQQDF